MFDTRPTSDISEEAQSSTAVEQRPTPDSFFNLTLVSFQVENTVFRVPKHGLNVPGTIFEATFSLPSSVNGEGSSNENPIHLNGIKEGHFRSFLRVMYPFTEQPPVVEFDDWVGVLHLSTMWEFNQIRNRAITTLSSQIDNKGALEKIHLARKYRVADWLRNAYIELIQKKTLELDDLTGTSLGLDWETIARIFYIRDGQPRAEYKDYYHAICGNYHGEQCPYGYDDRPAPPDTTTLKRVEKVFGEELEKLLCDVPGFHHGDATENVLLLPSPLLS